jgi:hypothetical protein
MRREIIADDMLKAISQCWMRKKSTDEGRKANTFVRVVIQPLVRSPPIWKSWVRVIMINGHPNSLQMR